MAEGGRIICDFDNDSFETLIHLYKPYLVKNLKVYDLVMSMVLPGRVVEAVMTLERNNQTEEAASVFLEALLQSDDPSKWSAFRDALNKPEHTLIVDILERGVTEDLRIHDELQNVVDLFRKDIIEALDPFAMCQYLQQADLLTLAEAQKVQACQRQDGDNMANFLLMSYVPRNKDWYLKFMKIIWAQGLMELVRLIDPEMYEKLSVQEEKPAYDATGESVHLDFQESGETSVKVLGAPPKTSKESFGYDGGLPLNLNDLQGNTGKSFNIQGDISEHKASSNKEKKLTFDFSGETKQYNIPLPVSRELSVDSNETENMISLDENFSTYTYHDEGTYSTTKSSYPSSLNRLSSKAVAAGSIGVVNSVDNSTAAGEDDHWTPCKTITEILKDCEVTVKKQSGHTNSKTSENHPGVTVAHGASPADAVITGSIRNPLTAYDSRSKTSMEKPKLRVLTEDELFPDSPQFSRNISNNNAKSTYPHFATAAEATPNNSTVCEAMMKSMTFDSCSSTESEQLCPTGAGTQTQASRDHSKTYGNQARFNTSTHNATVRGENTRTLTTSRYIDLQREPKDTIRDQTFVKPVYIPSRGGPNNIPQWIGTLSLETYRKNEYRDDGDEEIPAELVEQLGSIPDIDAPPERVNPHKYSQYVSNRTEPRARHQQQPNSNPKPKQAPGPQTTKSKPEETKPKSPEPIKGGMSDGYYMDVACLADDDMAMHGAMLSNAAKRPGNRENECTIS